MRRKRKNNVPSQVLVALAAGIICLLIYLPALQCGFVNFDDPEYILNNDLIRHLDRDLFISAFTQAHVGWWMPLTWISLALDYHFWQLNPFGYHLTNILLHAVNTALVVLLAGAVTKVRSTDDLSLEPRYLHWAMLLLAGLFFGIHPLRVESVAWADGAEGCPKWIVLNQLSHFLSAAY